MTKLAPVALLAVAAFAQPRIITTGPAAAHPGDTITITIGVDQTAGSGLSAAQWSLPLAVTVPQSQPSVQTNKAVICSSATCIVIGCAPPPVAGVFQSGTTFNTTALTDGPLQQLSYSVPTSATIGSVITLSASAPFGADKDGLATPLTVAPLSITITQSPTDLNGDGKTDLVDANLALGKWSNTKTDADFVILIRVLAYLAGQP